LFDFFVTRGSTCCDISKSHFDETSDVLCSYADVHAETKEHTACQFL
jgi:hypothetical protein